VAGAPDGVGVELPAQAPATMTTIATKAPSVVGR
jgi:hypothetical protein